MVDPDVVARRLLSLSEALTELERPRARDETIARVALFGAHLEIHF